MIVFGCRSCGRRIRVPQEMAGRQGKCPACFTVVTIPIASEESEFAMVTPPAPVSVAAPPRSATAAVAVTPPQAVAPPAPVQAQPFAFNVGSQGVVVTDVQMRFWSMVVFMVKWAIASIPAMIILFLIGLMLTLMGTLFMGILAAMFAPKAAAPEAPQWATPPRVAPVAPPPR